jgi:hypothetical protein
MSRAQMRAYARVQAAVDKKAALTRMLDVATTELNESIAVAASTGIPHNFLAGVTGYSEGRIWQLVNSWTPKRKAKNVNE